MIFDLVTLTLQVVLLKKKWSWTMTFESVGLLIVAIYIWLPPANYVVFLTTQVIRPSSDGTYYGMVMSIRRGLHPSVTVFHTFLLHALTYWAEILHVTFFLWTFDQVQVSSIFVGVMPLLELKILEIHSFPQFSPTCFDILHWNFAYDFVLLYYISSLSGINLHKFL